MKPHILSLCSACLVAMILAGCNAPEPQPVAATDNAAPAPASPPAEPARAFGRGLHLVPGLGPLSLTASGQKFSGNLTYGNATPFEGIKEAKVDISAFGGDGKKVAGPMPVSLDKGEDLTVFVTGVPGDVALIPYKPKNYGSAPGKAKVAFIHAAKALPRMDVKIDGKSFRRNVKYGVATTYMTLAPGRHVMQVEYDKSLPPTVIEVEQPTILTEDEVGNVVAVEQPTPMQTVIPRAAIVSLKQEMDLMPGKVYELVAFHDEKKLPKLRLLEDRFVDTLSKAKPAEQ
jgi:hypothetical protein